MDGVDLGRMVHKIWEADCFPFVNKGTEFADIFNVTRKVVPEEGSPKAQCFPAQLRLNIWYHHIIPVYSTRNSYVLRFP